MQEVGDKAGEDNAASAIIVIAASLGPLIEIRVRFGTDRPDDRLTCIIKYQLVFLALRILIPHLSFMLELVLMKSFLDLMNLSTGF